MVLEVSTTFGAAAFAAGAAALAAGAAAAGAALAAALALVVLVASSTDISSSEQDIATTPIESIATNTSPYWNFLNIHILRSSSYYSVLKNRYLY